MADDKKNLDLNPSETQEWLEALANVLEHEGEDRVKFLIQAVNATASQLGIQLNHLGLSNDQNTVNVNQQSAYPGDLALETRIDAINRWNAMMMVVRANKYAEGVGGHISTPCSVSRLYSVGFDHYFKGNDLIYFQGHATPINYARSFLEGRFSEEHLKNFRQEVEKEGLCSYPHPWLMPKYWQFPTVSMGLGAIQAIYQANFLKYLHERGLANTENRKVWIFCGDGEMDEPESRGALHLASRRELNNLIFVINCNLQRLDGPVYGNGSIVKEFESVFLGCGWEVIKVMWGAAWDEIFNKDSNGLIQARVANMVDGEMQNYGAKDGLFIRENFFNTPELKSLVSHLNDDDLFYLFRDHLGGHDFEKIHAAYARAIKAEKPAVLLVRTVKGFGLGPAGESQNIAHNVKKMTSDQMKYVRDRFQIPLTDEQVDNFSFYHPGEKSIEVMYLKKNREKLGGFLPARHVCDTVLPVPPLTDFQSLLEDRGTEQGMSNTMAFVRILGVLLKDKVIGKYIVPIVPDECRTFGMEGMFRQYGIYSIQGQLYTPVDREQLMYYRQAKNGQLMDEGISEGGAMSAWMAAATSYSSNDVPTIPFFVYYSMFGFQRIGDFAWAAGDMRARGFLIGGTAGRTSLPGEGLQHTDGHSHVFSSVIPNCISYDPTYAYELVIIIREGLRRMYENQEDIFYYLTVTTESYHHPAIPTIKNIEEGIIRGMYLLRESSSKYQQRVQLLGSGTILREVEAAAKILEQEYKISTDVWSVTSFNELRRDGLSAQRWNLMHPDSKPKTAYVEQCLANHSGPIIAATDYLRIFADQIREWIPRRYYTLGTDGFGRSDTRQRLRYFHEMDRHFIVIAALKALADEGSISLKLVKEAMDKYGIPSDKPDPVTV